MLVLGRRVGEEVLIGEDVRIVVLSVHRGRVRLGIYAPRSVQVDRQEVCERRSREAREPSPASLIAAEGPHD